MPMNSKREYKDNKGTAWKNKYKQKDTQPDYKGFGMIDGVAKEISMWINTSQAGDKYVTIAFEPEYVPNGNEGGQPAPVPQMKTVQQAGQQQENSLEDDIPF